MTQNIEDPETQEAIERAGFSGSFMFTRNRKDPGNPVLLKMTRNIQDPEIEEAFERTRKDPEIQEAIE